MNLDTGFMDVIADIIATMMMIGAGLVLTLMVVIIVPMIIREVKSILK